MPEVPESMQRPEGRLIQTAMRGRSATELAAIAGISAHRWRHIVNGYQPVGGTQVPVIAPPGTLARMAEAVGLTSDQLRATGRTDAADELRLLEGLNELGPLLARPDLPPLPRELDDLVALYLAADDAERTIIRGQVRLFMDDVQRLLERVRDRRP